MNKVVRLVVQLLCLAATVIGAILVDTKYTEYLFTCACLSVFLLILTSQLGWPTHIASIAFVLVLSGVCVNGAVGAKDDKEKAGYALTILGMWIAWGFTFEDTLSKFKALPQQLVADPLNIVALVAWLCNLLGCILLWAANDGKTYADLGTIGWVSGWLFVAGWWFKGSISLWVGFFWFAIFQVQVLSPPIAGCGGSDDGMCKAGGTFQWIGHVMFLGVMLWNAAGKSAQGVASGFGANIKQWQFWAYVVLLVVTIIGAIIAAASDFPDVKGWISANAIACSLFLLIACLLGPGTGASAGTDKETACQLIALGLCFICSQIQFQSADADRRSPGDDDLAAGNAIMITSMWCGFAFAAFANLGGAASGAAAFAGLFSGTIGIAALVLIVFSWVGLALMWRYADLHAGSGLALSIAVLLVLFIFLWATIVKKGGTTACVCVFVSAWVQYLVFATALSIRDRKDGSGVGEAPDIDTLKAGLIISWICELAFLLVCGLFIGADPNGGTGGVQSGGAAAGAPNNGTSPRVSPQEQQKQNAPGNSAVVPPA